MPFSRLPPLVSSSPDSDSDSLPTLPLLFSERVLLHLPLVYLFAGAHLARDAEGRGTVWITSERVVFASDEEEGKVLAWGREGVVGADAVQRGCDWPHAFFRCRLAQPTEGADARLDGYWVRRCAKRRRRTDSEEDDDEDERVDRWREAQPAAVMPLSCDAVQPPTADPMPLPPPEQKQAEEEFEDRIVEELRFVPPKPAVQLPLMMAAWNEGAAETAAGLAAASRQSRISQHLGRTRVVPPLPSFVNADTAESPSDDTGSVAPSAPGVTSPSSSAAAAAALLQATAAGDPTYSSLAAALAAPSSFLDDLDEVLPTVSASSGLMLSSSTRRAALFASLMQSTDDALAELELEAAARAT